MNKFWPEIAKILKKADPLQGFPIINRGLFRAPQGEQGVSGRAEPS